MMTDKDKIKQQLDAGANYVKMKSKLFCELARALNPSVDSEDEVEVSMALTFNAFDGKFNEVLNVNKQVAKRLVQSTILGVSVDSKTIDNKPSTK